ncbi:hypothetical protein [Oryzisolibacter sp. LB2S]|uniref:hypothetical protein n=1 Tax=Alicycliphilus soli TaxID=3228789 RepID=UPI0034577B49
MINKKQYIRLTIVLVIPLLAFGWWLADEEVLLSRHHVINCEEFDSHISCHSFSVTKNTADNWLHRNGAVTLWGARLAGGFHHPIVTLGHSEIKFVDGKTITLPPTDGGIKKFLNLPPRSIEDHPFASCEISPFADDIKNWGYSCSGHDFIPDGFYFQDEQTNHKFQEARKLIGKLRASNENMQIRAFLASFLAPIISYILLSVSLFLIMKIVKYVVYGRKSGAA